MAEVDFSHARIEPSTLTTANPTEKYFLSLNTNRLYAYGGTAYTTEIGIGTCTQLVNQQKQLVYQYQGTFNTSGTEFGVWVLGGTLAGWKVSNISFNNGDTYIFQIKADLICQ